MSLWSSYVDRAVGAPWQARLAKARGSPSASWLWAPLSTWQVVTRELALSWGTSALISKGGLGALTKSDAHVAALHGHAVARPVVDSAP